MTRKLQGTMNYHCLTLYSLALLSFSAVLTTNGQLNWTAELEYEEAYLKHIIATSNETDLMWNDSYRSSNIQRSLAESSQNSRREQLFNDRCSDDRLTPFCICTEDELRDKISKANGPVVLNRFTEVIRICLGAEILINSGPINITGKAFTLTCGPVRIPGRCGLVGSTLYPSPAFIGAPKYAYFFGIYMAQFTNTAMIGDNSTAQYFNNGLGGIMYLTGGYTRTFELQFLYGLAKKGGAIYLTGPKTKLDISRSLVSGNTAEYGGAIYITNNATLSLIRPGISSNYATISGGVLYFDKHSKGRLDGVLFLNNSAYDDSNEIVIQEPVYFVDCNIGGRLFPVRICDGSKDGIVVNNKTGDIITVRKDKNKATNCHRLVNTKKDYYKCNRFRRSPTY